MNLFLILLCGFIGLCQQIYSLEENLICLIKPCDVELIQYNYGTSTYGDLTSVNFALTFLIKFYGSPSSFIASLTNYGTQVTKLQMSSQFQFKVEGFYINPWSILSQNFNADRCFQIVITQKCIFFISKMIEIQVCDFLQCFITDHRHNINIDTQLIILDDVYTDYNKIVACCIMMYKGISYPNSHQFTFYNTKYPEAMIDINVQEREQSNLTVDYSDYKYVAKLGQMFEFDQFDPYLYGDGLLFNGSQFIQINQITLYNQSTFEFRLQKSNIFTSNVILLDYIFLTIQIQIILSGHQVIYKFNDQQAQFQLLEEPFIHFCIGVVQHCEGQLQQIYFIQFSNSDMIQILKQNITAKWTVNNGFGFLKLGSIQSIYIYIYKDQFNFGENFNLFHFRQYQGFFYDDQSVMNISCQIYLNDRCIICKSGYKLTNNHSCALQCDNTQYMTKFIPSHNQCLRQCFPKCASCIVQNPSICITCYGVRINPPNCDCPSNYFEDNVSPNCRKYYPDVTVQTGMLTAECDSASQFVQFTVNFGYTYFTTPLVLYSLIGAGIQYYDIGYALTHYVSQVQADSFKISLYCTEYHLYVINWISSVGFNLGYQFNSGQILAPYQMKLNYMTLSLYGEILNPIFYTVGWNYKFGSPQYMMKQKIDNSIIEFYSLYDSFNKVFYLSFYTQFKTYQISDQSLDAQLDDQPKSVQAFVLQRGFSIQGYDKFIYLPNLRSSTYFQMKQRYMIQQTYDWLLIMPSQRCRNNSGPCDFYQSYDSYCNLQFPFCSYVKAAPNYFVNSSYYYERIYNIKLECHITCQTCTGNGINQCSTCYSSQNMILSGSTCIYNCDSNCLTCSDVLNTTCYSCVTNAYLSNNKCVCNNGYYFNQSQCSKCPHQCLTCSSSDICLTCPAGLIKNLNICDCGNGQYYDENNVCHACQQKCRTCVNDLQCTTCKDPQQILGVGDCLCPYSYYSDNNHYCQPCKANCLACQDFDHCVQCKDDFLIINNQCICDKNQYLDQICYDCNIKCKTCDGPSANQCLTCYEDRYQLIVNDSIQCVCLAGYFENLDSTFCSNDCFECESLISCTKCHTNQQLVNGKCRCSDGYFNFNNNCLSCETQNGKYILECNFVDCSDKIWTPSEQCDDGNNIQNDGCTNCLIDKNYKCLNRLNQQSICFKCQDQCRDCDYDKNQIQCRLCNDGYYLIDNSCQLCSINCKTCSQYSRCISCPIINTYPDEELKCPKCGYGQYQQSQQFENIQYQQKQCYSICGDGIKSEQEQCDDGNTYSADGCNNQCQIEDSFVCVAIQNQSICIINENPRFYISNTIRMNNQYLIQFKSNQKLHYNNIDVKVLFPDYNQYNQSYDVEYKQNVQIYNYLTINVTINFIVSVQYEVIQIYIGGDIHNIYNQTVTTTIFKQELKNVYILNEIQLTASQVSSQMGSILFIITLSLTLLQLFLSGVSSISLMIKTSNYIFYMRYMNIDFPPNLRIMFAQFSDYNIIKFINVPSLIFQQFDIDIQNQFTMKAENDYNNNDINADFIANIIPFIISILQVNLLIKLLKIVVQIIHERIVKLTLQQVSYESKQMKVLRYIQFYLLKSIQKFIQNGILELFLIQQYQIYFAILISLKSLQFNSFYDYVSVILTFTFSLYFLNFVQKQIRNQSLFDIIGLINHLLFIFSIVYLNNFQLIQILFMSLQELIQVIFQISEAKFYNFQALIEQISLLLLFLTSISYVYSPIDIDYIQIGFIQIAALIITFAVNAILQIFQLYGQVTKYLSNSSINQKQE